MHAHSTTTIALYVGSSNYRVGNDGVRIISKLQSKLFSFQKLLHTYIHLHTYIQYILTYMHTYIHQKLNIPKNKSS